jgi:hypothetical protein
MLRPPLRMLFPLVALTLLLSACGSSNSAAPSRSSGSSAPTSTTILGVVNPNAKEQLPPGDIPDTQVFVPFTATDGRYSIRYPQGWAKRVSATATTFSQDLNSITVSSNPLAVAPTIASARSSETTALKSLAGFQLVAVDSVARSAGTAIRVVYDATSAADAVTGKTGTLEFERYLFWHRGTVVTVTLASPKGSDNVDPWKTVTDSLAWK